MDFLELREQMPITNRLGVGSISTTLAAIVLDAELQMTRTHLYRTLLPIHNMFGMRQSTYREPMDRGSSGLRCITTGHMRTLVGVQEHICLMVLGQDLDGYVAMEPMAAVSMVDLPET